MLRLSKLTDYAVVILSRLGPVESGWRSVTDLAADTGLPEPTVAKVLKLLGRGALVQSQRGAAGGYRLARPASDISVAAVIAAMEGPIAVTACVDEAHETCSVGLCPMRGNWQQVNVAIRTALEAVSVADMTTLPFDPAVPAPVAVHAQ